MTEPAEMEKAIRAALEAHGKWRLRLKTAITTRRSDITPEIAACDDKCEFGRWLYGPTVAPETQESVPYQVVRRLHAEFHERAGAALEAALSGQRRKADKIAMVAFEERSTKLTKALNKWLGEVRAD